MVTGALYLGSEILWDLVLDEPSRVTYTLYSSCGVKWDPSGEDLRMHITFIFFIYMFGFIIPMVIIFTSYLKIIKTIKLKVWLFLFKVEDPSTSQY